MQVTDPLSDSYKVQVDIDRWVDAEGHPTISAASAKTIASWWHSPNSDLSRLSHGMEFDPADVLAAAETERAIVQKGLDETEFEPGLSSLTSSAQELDALIDWLRKAARVATPMHEVEPTSLSDTDECTVCGGDLWSYRSDYFDGYQWLHAGSERKECPPE